LFLKFDVAVDVLRRLADLGVAPPVLDSGEHRGHSFAVQPFVGGGYPPKAWFGAHLLEVTMLVSAYHADARLRELIAPSPEPQYHAHVTELLAGYDRRAQSAGSRGVDLGFAPAVARLREMSRELKATRLVPTHGDPNNKNFVMLNEVHALLVDWDDLGLSDPFRDVGQILWWYVPPPGWPAFLDRLHLDSDAEAMRSLYWWVGAESLDVALSLAEHGMHEKAAAFIDDFEAALAQRPNPHANA
jgi:aminoglycoside phosphotransferase (APT) family kinase protein